MSDLKKIDKFSFARDGCHLPLYCNSFAARLKNTRRLLEDARSEYDCTDAKAVGQRKCKNILKII